MNELQKKLARRRCLNGEDGSAPAESPPAIGLSTDSSRDVPKLESRKSVNFSKKDPAPSSASGVDELQRKLARRRNANGESVNDSSVLVTGSTFDVKRETSTSSVSSEVSSLQNLPEVEDTSQDSQLSKQPSIESLPPVEEEGSDADGTVSTAAAEDAAHSVVVATERAVEQEPTEPVEVAEEKQPPSAHLESRFPSTLDNDSLDTAAVGSTDVAATATATATAADALAASSEPTDVDDSAVSITVESTDSEGHKEEKAHATDQEAAPVVPVTTTTSVTSEIFKAAEEMMNMVDQELDSFLQSHTTSAPSSQPTIPLGRSKKPSSDLFDDDDSSLFAASEASDAALTALADAVPVGLKGLRQPLSTSPVRSRLLSSSGQPPVVDHAGPVESLPAPSSSPNPRRAALARSTSGGPVVTTQPPLVPRQLSPPPTPKAEPALRSVSPAPSTSAADLSALVSSPSGSKRVTPSSSSKASRGSAPTTPNGAGEKWYPGKYLLGGRWGGARHKMEMMNSEQAQSLYNDLIASGDKPAQHKSRQGSISGTPSSPAITATATATATETVAVVTGDSSTASLLTENHRLKQEITRLRRLLDEKQAVIDAYELSESLRNGSGSGGVGSGGGVGVGGALRSARAAFDATPSLVAGEADAHGDDNDDDDDGADSGFEDDALFGGANAHRRNAAATRRYPDLTSLERLLEPSSSATAIGSGVAGDDGLTALLTSDRDVAHFNPRTLGNEADLVRSYNYSTAGRVTDGPGSGHALADGHGEGGDSSGGSSSGEGGAGDEEPPALPYESFLQLFAKSADLQFMTKAFILSVLGPHGDASPPVGKKDKLGYIFYGTHKLDERCRQFFDDLEARLVRDAAFRVLQTEDELICARDGLEQYVLHRIGQHAYKLTETVDEDRQLMRRMQILSTFITPAHLEIPPAYFEEEMLRQAGRELKAINNFRTPGDKVACIVKCVTVIFRSLAVARKRQEEKLYLEQQAAKQHAQDPEDTAVSTSGANSPHGTAAPATATATAAATATATAAAHSESSSPSGETASEATKRDEDGGATHRKEAAEGGGEENERGEDDDQDDDRDGDEDDEEEAKPKLALAGADDFLPLFIWVVLQSKIPRLVSNAEYIHAYLNPKRLMGKSGYCLINLRSAIDFVTYVEASSLKIDPEYFAAQVAAVEATLPAEDDDA